MVKLEQIQRVLGRHLTKWIALAAVLMLAAPAAALDPLPAPKGPVILLVSGNIEITNSPRGAEFDREMLYGLGVVEIKTTTAWTDGIQVFEGVLLRKLFERLGATGTTVTATALNDYIVTFPFEDAATYDVIAAARMNGVEMKVRDRGPLWVVYPREDHPELQAPEYNDRWAWQLRELHVQ